MRYHEARSARFIGHCWGRGWRDATENLLQTSIINRFGCFPMRRICSMKKVQLLFLCASRFRWGTVVHGGGVVEQKNKQTKHRQQVERAVSDSRESWQALFFFVLKTRANPKTERDHGRLWRIHNIKQTLSTRSVDTWEWMRHIHFVDCK